jgi:hypothetical protein
MFRVGLYARYSSNQVCEVLDRDQLRLAGPLGMLFEHYAR